MKRVLTASESSGVRVLGKLQFRCQQRQQQKWYVVLLMHGRCACIDRLGQGKSSVSSATFTALHAMQRSGSRAGTGWAARGTASATSATT
eukprot:2612722-Pleurochrysis_carterae.AAC.4